jgi:hypothetical protein
MRYRTVSYRSFTAFGSITQLMNVLESVLAPAGIDRGSVIRITGSAGLAALLWFCRHGYTQVGYVQGGPSPADGGDLLLVPQTLELDALDRLLSRGPHVRAGGVLIVQTAEHGDTVAPDPAQLLLVRHGYHIERCIHGQHRTLHVARRQPRAVFALAA